MDKTHIPKELFLPADKEERQGEQRRSRSVWRDIAAAFAENKLALCCLVILTIIVLASLAAPFTPYDPDEMDVTEQLMGISGSHWLGTDDLGRDTFTRALYGGRISLMVGFAAMAVSTAAGTLAGTVSGYAGGRTDTVIMRIVDIFMSVPSLLLIIIIYAFIPQSMVTLILMLSLFSWTKVARIVRAETLSLKERDFVLAARSLGVSHSRIVVRHIIPNLTSQIIVAASLSVASAILDESALSFLGYGVKLPLASWGSMLQNAQKYILYEPLLAVVPGILILLTVLCFNILGDALQHALDPKLRKK